MAFQLLRVWKQIADFTIPGAMTSREQAGSFVSVEVFFPFAEGIEARRLALGQEADIAERSPSVARFERATAHVYGFVDQIDVITLQARDVSFGRPEKKVLDPSEQRH